jgi:signal transduction histidine kinase
MQDSPTPPTLQRPPRPALLQGDVVAVLATTLAVAVLATRFEWNEAVYSLTRRWEWAQLDEWPLVVFALAICLAWLSWRRSRQAVTQLRARLLAEAELAAALVDNQRLAHQNLRIQETERKHLAGELHDELGQYSNAIKLDAVSIVQDPGLRDTQAVVAAQRIVQAADHVHSVVSDLIRRLRPTGLDELGLVAAIESCVDQWRQTQPGTRYDLGVDGVFDDLGELTTLTVYRVIQEGLTNCARHAGATGVQINLTRGPNPASGRDELCIDLSDNGRGADLATNSTGFGLRGMKERVTVMGGVLHVDSAPGKGFSIAASIPSSGHE